MDKQKLNIILPSHARKQNRLKGYDYSSDGFYFVTICIKDKRELFGQVKKGEMVLNGYGGIVVNQWLWLAKQYLYVQLDEFVVMPNHMHGIIVIDSDRDLSVKTDHVETGRDLSLRGRIKIKSLSELIGAFKTTSSKLIHESGLDEFCWQRSFYDHIIRSEKSLNNIRQYIYDNPMRWELDRNNPENLYM